jgi:hypothetical protein
MKLRITPNIVDPGRDGDSPIFHPAPELTQDDVLAIVERTSERILRFLKRRGVITLVTAPGEGEVTVVTDETMGEKDPLLARLLAAATAGASVPSGPRACPPNPAPRGFAAPVARRSRAQAGACAHRARPRRHVHGQGQASCADSS